MTFEISHPSEHTNKSKQLAIVSIPLLLQTPLPARPPTSDQRARTGRALAVAEGVAQGRGNGVILPCLIQSSNSDILKNKKNEFQNADFRSLNFNMQRHFSCVKLPASTGTCKLQRRLPDLSNFSSSSSSSPIPVTLQRRVLGPFPKNNSVSSQCLHTC